MDELCLAGGEVWVEGEYCTDTWPPEITPASGSL